ncbi:hypothetical protein EU545_03980 [Candidatus Thorarchaeota archaeon]|nr:MAG: hypothetical protein EU545_03980 [Candidatus Thorarchaeota archaeon]
MSPAVRLAKEVGVSTPTAISWLDKMRDEEVFRGVKANLRVHDLGLEIYDFLLEVSSFEALERIEKFCEVHPYTLYRARVYGGDHRGILIQFRQPDTAFPHLQTALQVMKREGLVNGIRELPTLRSIYGSTHTTPLLSAWDPDRMVWLFDWQSWWETEPQRSARDIPSAAEDRQPPQPLDLDYLDAQILQALTADARRKNIDIIRSVGLDPREGSIQQRVSKKIKRLKAAVESYRVFINWTYFDVYNTPMIMARADSETTDRLIAKLKGGGFPFSSSIRKTTEGFVWFARLPSAHFSELVTLVWRIADSYELLIMDYRHSQTYGLWAETLDKESEEWKTGREFCLDIPLQEIGLDI